MAMTDLGGRAFSEAGRFLFHEGDLKVQNQPGHRMANTAAPLQRPPCRQARDSAYSVVRDRNLSLISGGLLRASCDSSGPMAGRAP